MHARPVHPASLPWRAHSRHRGARIHDANDDLGRLAALTAVSDDHQPNPVRAGRKILDDELRRRRLDGPIWFETHGLLDQRPDVADDLAAADVA